MVGLFTDNSPGTMVRFEDRKASLLGLEAVSEVIELAFGDLTACIETLRPHTVVKGKEHESLSNAEQDVVSSYGGHLLFSAGEQTFSSRDLIRFELANPSGFEMRAVPDAFFHNHKLTAEVMLNRVKAFSQLQVLVIGDLIIDEYIYCDPLGMSQEDPTIVVTPIETQSFVGAAGIVAAHLAGLGAKVQFLSIVGDDAMARTSQAKLEKMNVSVHFVHDESRPTVVKQRFRAQNKTLLRVSYLRSHDSAKEYLTEAMARLLALLDNVQLVVFSDFNYGCLPQALVDQIIDVCSRRRVPFVADSQASSQTGNVGRFIGADLLAATEYEARVATNDFKSGLQNVANRLISQSGASGLLLKLGPEGVVIVQKRPEFCTDSLPAFNPNPLDLAGAGDAMLATASLTRLAGGSIFEAAYLGSIASALHVSSNGNMPLSAQRLTEVLRPR